MYTTLALFLVGGAAAAVALDWIHRCKERATTGASKMIYAASVGLILGLMGALGSWAADKPDPKAECFYAAFQQAPALMPHLAPGEKVYGRVKACDGLSPADISSLEGTFQRAFDAAVTR